MVLIQNNKTFKQVPKCINATQQLQSLLRQLKKSSLEIELLLQFKTLHLKQVPKSTNATQMNTKCFNETLKNNMEVKLWLQFKTIEPKQVPNVSM